VNPLWMAIREIVGLFFDDEFLALGMLGVVGITAILRDGTSLDPMIPAATLFGGCLLVLIGSVGRAAHSSKRG
jgi:hypothetical protein